MHPISELPGWAPDPGKNRSKGAYVPQPSAIGPDPYSSLTLGTEGDSLCFIKCLLGKRYVYTCHVDIQWLLTKIGT